PPGAYLPGRVSHIACPHLDPTHSWRIPSAVACAMLLPLRARDFPMNIPSPPVPRHVLAALPPQMSTGLFAKARPVTLDADQVLFLSGDPGDGCYRVDEGLLKVSVVAGSGGERILAVLGPGAILGELSMISEAPRNATVTAIRDSKLSFVSRGSFDG